ADAARRGPAGRRLAQLSLRLLRPRLRYDRRRRRVHAQRLRRLRAGTLGPCVPGPAWRRSGPMAGAGSIGPRGPPLSLSRQGRVTPLESRERIPMHRVAAVGSWPRRIAKRVRRTRFEWLTIRTLLLDLRYGGYCGGNRPSRFSALGATQTQSSGDYH